MTAEPTSPRCLCSHSRWRHAGEKYGCRSRACGCREYRPAVKDESQVASS